MLNIINYNPDYKEDVTYIDQVIEIFTDIKNNINKKQYTAYQEFLVRVNKFMNMMLPNLEKDINAQNSKSTIFEIDDNLDDDNISIASISDYEAENDDKDERLKEVEDMLIHEFEEKAKQMLNNNNLRFDFEFVAVY
jgi:hypothetical protein